MEKFDKLFNEDITDSISSMPTYCNGSISLDIANNRIYSINLPKFYTWADNKILTKEQADYFRSFIQNKITNKTLYTPDNILRRPETKRFQLFVNSNVAEHALVDVLNGKLLAGNDELTIDSKAIIGDDGCALADVTIDDIDIEVKVTLNNTTKKDIFNKAHNKKLVAVYTITPGSGASVHWEFWVRDNVGNYVLIDKAAGEIFGTKDVGNIYDEYLVTKALDWQSKLKVKANTIKLLHFLDNDDGSCTITVMSQGW